MRKRKLALKLNKPAYIGMCILELSKILMYKFHYDFIKNKYNNKLKLSFTDTVSLMYEMKMSMKTLQAFKECLVPVITQLSHNDNLNKLIMGIMKDETGGIAIEEFIELKPKMYSFLVDNSE